MQEIKWIEKNRKIYNYGKREQVIVKFLRTNVQDFYNNYMNCADIADQLRGNYCIDTHIRNMKWW